MKKKTADEIYKEWCGNDRLENSVKLVHDSTDAIEFAKYYHNEMLQAYGISRNKVADCGDLSFKCRFRKGDDCYSIDECSLKM